MSQRRLERSRKEEIRQSAAKKDIESLKKLDFSQKPNFLVQQKNHSQKSVKAFNQNKNELKVNLLLRETCDERVMGTQERYIEVWQS